MMAKSHKGVHTEQEHLVVLVIDVVKDLRIVGSVFYSECPHFPAAGITNHFAGGGVGIYVGNGKNGKDKTSQLAGDA